MFTDRLAAAAESVQEKLDQNLEAIPGNLGEAMRHTTQGGKRLRAFLVMESAQLHGIPEKQALWPATAIEVMHAYSLVHDDLPCMDNDSLRRGRPTIHVKWDEATAVLAGDALQALAFELAAHPSCSADPMVRAELAHSLAAAAGGRVRDKRLWTEIAALTGGSGNSTALVGTAEQVAESLLDYYDIGIDNFLIRGFDPFEDAIEYGRDLIPLVRAAVATRDADAGLPESRARSGQAG